MKLLSVNAGSSSLKFRVYEMPEEKLLMKGMFERIGLEGSSYNIRVGEEKTQILDNITKEFDEKLSDENIAKIVQQALSSGFIELNGEIQTVQDLLINSINNSAEGYSAMASVIKNELVANLNIALDTMRELENINSSLGLKKFDIANSVSTSPIRVPEYSGGNGNNVTIGDTHITVTGSVDDITLGKIEELIKESQDDMLMRITKNL